MLQILILAGGKATRMGGDCPKALVEVKNKPIIEWLLESTSEACPRPTIVVGYRGDEIISRLGKKYDYVFQKQQLGTAHAVLCARKFLEGKRGITSVLVLFGDHPLVTSKTAVTLGRTREESGASIAMATVHVPNFDGDFALFKDWGRIVTDENGGLVKVVESKDATDEERKITEVSPSFFCFDPSWMWANLPLVKNENAKKEYGLTDTVNLAIQQNKKIVTLPVPAAESMGANTPEEIAIVSKYFKE